MSMAKDILLFIKAKKKFSVRYRDESFHDEKISKEKKKTFFPNKICFL